MSAISMESMSMPFQLKNNVSSPKRVSPTQGPGWVSPFPLGKALSIGHQPAHPRRRLPTIIRQNDVRKTRTVKVSVVIR